MPTEKDLMEQFKRDCPEEFKRLEKTAREMLKDIPELPQDNFRQRIKETGRNEV